MSFSKVPPPTGETSVENSSKTSINILLLGETGVGKSTFINSFANYVQRDTLADALKADLLCLIPTKVTITDENFDTRDVHLWNDKKEVQTTGQSATQCATPYIFKTEDNREIHLIDTPGIGDVRGTKQDNINFENILSFLGQYEYLHAICILLKPNVTRLSPYFEFCFMHLLSRLDKSAAQNIIFIFTNARSTSYRPKGTMPILKTLLQKIECNPPYIKIPCNKNNIFCMDNEAFEFLVALKYDCKFSSEETKSFSSSWEVSVQTCYKILDYVAGENEENSIMPHLIRNTLSVNVVRKVINNLIKPLNEICDVIQENLDVLNERQKAIAVGGQTIEEFIKKLKVPSIKLHRNEFEKPRTVCASAKCIERITVKDKVHIRYKQVCHECEILVVSPEIIGSFWLRFCSAMDLFGNCKYCDCSYAEHMQINYELVTEDIEEEDESVAQDIVTAKDQIKIQKEFIAKLQGIKSEYEAESQIINKCLAKFAYFLRDNAIAVFNDAYESYLDYIIERETSYGSKANQNFLDKHIAFKTQYQEEKRILESILKNPNKDHPQGVTVNEVYDLISQLYDLKHTGEKIKELHLTQEKMASKATEENAKNLNYNAIVIKAKSGYKMFKNAVNKVGAFVGNVLDPTSGIQDGRAISLEADDCANEKFEVINK